ncbi:MAG: hypothetical protein CM15mP54_15580 [Paracoccaceae bacterium]|nr:MAG: hypothetical protein CM15mP54_15580 [Paracoccaceae bacterium]
MMIEVTSAEIGPWLIPRRRNYFFGRQSVWEAADNGNGEFGNYGNRETPSKSEVCFPPKGPVSIDYAQ